MDWREAKGIKEGYNWHWAKKKRLEWNMTKTEKDTTYSTNSSATQCHEHIARAAV